MFALRVCIYNIFFGDDWGPWAAAHTNPYVNSALDRTLLKHAMKLKCLTRQLNANRQQNAMEMVLTEKLSTV